MRLYSTEVLKQHFEPLNELFDGPLSRLLQGQPTYKPDAEWLKLAKDTGHAAGEALQEENLAEVKTALTEFIQRKTRTINSKYKDLAPKVLQAFKTAFVDMRGITSVIALALIAGVALVRNAGSTNSQV